MCIRVHPGTGIRRREAALTIALTLLCVAAQGGEMPQSYLSRMSDTLEAIRADLPAMRTLADQAASRLANGGKLWVTGPRPLVGEFCGRAGGLMMIRALGDKKPGAKDVVLAFVDREGSTPVLPMLDGTLVIAFSDKPSPPDAPSLNSHAGGTGVSPTLAEAASGWVFAAELVAALTRLGKMPVMYLTIGEYDGHQRIQDYRNGEIAWHEDHKVPRIEPGVLGGRYIEAVSSMLKRIEKEGRKDLHKAGSWAREARRRYMLSMGHIFPEEISDTEIGKLFESATWNAGFRRRMPEFMCDDDVSGFGSAHAGNPDPAKTPKHLLGKGDFVCHIGYQHPPDDLLRIATRCGARAVYVCLRIDRDFARDPNVIRIDPMWDWPDACVIVEGYDIPILPASGVVNGSIAWEIHRLAR